MTIINPNSIAGITSVTAQADIINFYKSNGTPGSLQIDGCNFNTTTGVSTFSNLVVGGTLTYEDVKNVDSVGIVTARQGVNVTGGGIHVTSGVVTATSFVGSGAALTGIANPVTVDSYHNVFGGTDAGASLNSSSNNNVLFGQDAGDSITSGYENVCIGLRAGQALTDTRRNTCLGSDAGRNFGAGDSTFIGWNAGSAAASNGNVCIGHNAGTEANGNDTAVGYSAGPTGNYSGHTNVCFGFAAANGLRQSATYNTIIGPGAGKNAATGQVNIEGDSNIIIGHEASLSSTTVDNECVIGALEGNSKAITNFRIPGTKFAANTTGVGIGTTNPSNALDVEGNVSSTTQFSGFDGLRIHNANGSAHNVTADMYFTAGTGSANRGAAIGVQFTSAASGNDLYFATNAGNVTSTNTLTERLRITSGGLVGINTASPQGTLDVRGSIYLTSNGGSGGFAGSGLWFSHPTTNAEYFQLYMSSSDNSLRLKTGGIAWKDSITVKENGPIGIGTDTPGTRDINGSLDIIQDHANNGPHFRVLNKHSTYGGGVQFKNNNAMGGIEFLNASGNNVLGIYNTTGGWHWGSTLNIPHGNYFRIGKNSGSYIMDIDSQSSTDGHIIAAFNGAESSNHAGLMIAHYLCGSDDNRTGLYWEHQNVSNERMWMGDDKRLYLKNSNPTESTAQGRYIMTVEAGVPDFPDGQSYDDAAKSALEIKKHYPASQSGNYWIFDHNNVPRQIYCDMEIDGGGWMLWNDYNTSATSMNEALGGSSTSPNSGLARGNWGNYAYYQVLIRASDIDSTGERLHSIVQLDGSGALKYCADYGCDFFMENVGDQYQPERSDYFASGSSSEYIQMDRAYDPQLGATGWQTFSGGGWQSVYIREMDSRMSPGMHRSCHLVERIYGFDDAGVPRWEQADSMSCLPYWTDISLGNSEVANGYNDFMMEHGRKIVANNGNNGAFAQGRMHGVLTGQFEVEVKLGYSWGWSQAVATSTMQIAENLRDASGSPYAIGTNHYYYAGIYNNNSNNKWMPVVNSPYAGYTEFQRSGGAGTSISHYIWRTSDGTISCRRSDNTHGTINLGIPYAGPLIITSGRQSPMMTEIVGVWDSKRTDQLSGRSRWYK